MSRPILQLDDRGDASFGGIVSFAVGIFPLVITAFLGQAVLARLFALTVRVLFMPFP